MAVERPRTKRIWNVALLVASLAVGFGIAVQWRSQSRLPVSISEYSRQESAETIVRLETEQAALKETITQLRAELATYQELAADTGTLAQLQAQLQAARALAGLLPLTGPGVQVVLDDSRLRMQPVPENVSAYLIHEYDLRDVVNLLWMAGSEAIAINDERLVGTTSIYCVGSTILVNDTRLSPPYLIAAIGDPDAQVDMLNNPLYLENLRQRAKIYGVQFTVSRQDELIIPAFDGGFRIEYARVREQER